MIYHRQALCAVRSATVIVILQKHPNIISFLFESRVLQKPLLNLLYQKQYVSKGLLFFLIRSVTAYG